ncbi:hypothetical protein Taro_018045 [Colocasia esculenta]|uniref:Uncharacterized protein n=1 Tax=Colocasia esculenta TaxID=4460 RepID=A0A843UV47_COLES|nr:hypothetical protein [Colocasia esculenta]
MVTRGPKTGADKCPPPGDNASEYRAEQCPQRLQMWEIFHKLRIDYDTYSVAAAPLRLTPDVATFHDLRLDYGTYPAVAAPNRLIKSLSMGAQHVGREARLLKSNRPQMWQTFHKRRLDYDTCPAVTVYRRGEEARFKIVRT